jgi:hypothetical protein
VEKLGLCSDPELSSEWRRVEALEYEKEGGQTTNPSDRVEEVVLLLNCQSTVL